MKRVLGQWMAVCFIAVVPGLALAAFDSGSTGVDGPFNPTVNTVVQLPPSGVFNFTTVNIPVGVTVTFKKNSANTPVVILASGDVAIAGVLDVRAAKSADTGAAGDGNLGDDGLPGTGGPGGFDGGRGGLAPNVIGGSGVGPGGATPGIMYNVSYPCGGGGGGYSQAGSSTYCGVSGPVGVKDVSGMGGASYGSSVLLPLVGGSGGGGGMGGTTFAGSGGGGGGGAILIASTTTVNVTGSILADGSASGAANGAGAGAVGGGGSGGAIRIVASTISGNGTVSAQGGAVGSSQSSYQGGASGAPGRVRLEASAITRTSATNPVFTTDLPGSVFVAGAPTLAISSVAGVAAPAAPTGNADIVLPATTVNPVTVTFTTTGVPVGNTIKLTVTPASGAATSVVSPALTGSTTSASSSVQVTLPQGPSVLQAQTTYTIVAALGDVMSRYAGNERVERVTLTAIMGKSSTATLHTISGKEYQVPAMVLASLGAGFQ
ncbi:MAG: hypothetical protein KGZ83_00275 [Sulfuricella sp.]|nr:hypothetical protein [Sulfuricella sp.]